MCAPHLGAPLAAGDGQTGLRSKDIRPILLVLYNMEGVLDGADVLGELLDASALLTILVTSRIALHPDGEYEFPLAPLAVPNAEQRGDAPCLAEVPSIKLFLARSAAANPRMDVGNDMDALAELCVRLDGLPLAIELVAAQVADSSRDRCWIVSPAISIRRTTWRAMRLLRQRTLRRVIDSSFDLLDDGGQDRPAPAFGVRRRIHAGSRRGGRRRQSRFWHPLVARGEYPRRHGSVVLPGNAMRDEPRYAMLETLRAYGRERLNASGEADSVRKAHAAYCLVLAEEGLGVANCSSAGGLAGML